MIEFKHAQLPTFQTLVVGPASNPSCFRFSCKFKWEHKTLAGRSQCQVPTQGWPGWDDLCSDWSLQPSVTHLAVNRARCRSTLLLDAYAPIRRLYSNNFQFSVTIGITIFRFVYKWRHQLRSPQRISVQLYIHLYSPLMVAKKVIIIINYST